MAATIDLALVAPFLAVADTASFSAAAKAMGVTKGTISRAVARLEASVGAELFHRTTRQVALSTAGAALYERTAPHLAAIRQALGTLPEREERPSGELRITAPTELGSTLLAEVVAEFAARYPEVRVDAHLTNRKVDIVGEGFDVALRAVGEPLKDSSLVVRRLVASGELRFFASPRYLARRGQPRHPGDPDHEWVWFRPVAPRLLALPAAFRPRIVCDDLFFVREATRAGGGVGLLPPFLAGPYVAAGELSPVLPGHHVRGGGLVLLYPSVKNVPRKVTAFRDLVVEALSGDPFAAGRLRTQIAGGPPLISRRGRPAAPRSPRRRGRSTS